MQHGRGFVIRADSVGFAKEQCHLIWGSSYRTAWRSGYGINCETAFEPEMFASLRIPC